MLTPRTIGIRGRMHGSKMVRTPAIKSVKARVMRVD